MDETDIYAALTYIFQKLFERNDIVLQAGTTAADIEGWDSFRHVEIVLAVQRHFGMKFSAKQLDGLECVGDMVRIIDAR